MNIKNKIVIIFIICILIPISASCQKKINDIILEDIEFAKKIEAISITSDADYIYLDSLEEMIKQTHPNLIIRGKVTARKESAVISPLSYYTNADLKSENADNVKYARAYISTPYEIQIDEVYYGNVNEVNDVITINAPYGILDGYEERKADHPIFNIGNEYILFLRVDEIFGLLDYYLAFTPASCLKLNTEKGTFEYGKYACEAIYSQYKNDMKELINDLQNLTRYNDYSTKIEKVGDIEKLQKLIDQKKLLESK